jgi:peptide/nickel transport system permease protein
LGRFLVARLLQSAIAVFGVVALVFVLMRLSGDPTLLLVPDGATREDIALLRSQLGFDRPLHVQFVEYLGQMARLDFGQSLVQRVPVTTIVVARLPYTLWLAGASLLLAVVIGVPVGIATGIWRGTALERGLMAVVLVGQSMPTFWSGILLIMLFAVTLGWLPSSGADSPVSVVMPATALGALSMATFARITRTAVVEEMDKDYVRAARAKGLTGQAVVGRHVLRNASIPLITVVALEIANLLAGAVVVETVFAWPGLGQLAVQAIQSRDFLIVQAVVLLGAFAHVGLNLIADILYGVVDPRIRHRRGAA